MANQEFVDHAKKVLSGVNVATLCGATNTTWSGNATITLVAAAVLALAPLAGTGPDALRAAAKAIRDGVLIGAYAETHGLTTIAGAQAAVQAIDPNLPANYTGSLLDA